MLQCMINIKADITSSKFLLSEQLSATHSWACKASNWTGMFRWQIEHLAFGIFSNSLDENGKGEMSKVSWIGMMYRQPFPPKALEMEAPV